MGVSALSKILELVPEWVYPIAAALVALLILSTFVAWFYSRLGEVEHPGYRVALGITLFVLIAFLYLVAVVVGVEIQRFFPQIPY